MPGWKREIMYKKKKKIGIQLEFCIFYMFSLFHPGTHNLSQHQKKQATLCIDFRGGLWTFLAILALCAQCRSLLDVVRHGFLIFTSVWHTYILFLNSKGTFHCLNSDWEKPLKFEAEGREFVKMSSHSRSEQYWLQNTIFRIFVFHLMTSMVLPTKENKN